METGLEYFVPSGMSGLAFERWKDNNRKALLALENSRGSKKADDDEPVIERVTSNKDMKMSNQDIRECDHINTSSYETKGKRLAKQIKNWKEERNAFLNSDKVAISNLNLNSDPLYANVERVRRDIYIEEAQEELSKVDQILAYRLVNVN